ncbi:MAG: glycosyltransferase [Desulfobacteraceae bacterium]
MKKVLIIAYHFPPSPVMGSQRPYRLAKYFPSFGWQPTVLTAKLPGNPPEGITIVETEYKDVLGLFKSRFGFNNQKGLHEQLGIAEPSSFASPTWKSKFIKNARKIIAFPERQIGWYKYALEAGSELLERENYDIIISTSPPVTAHIIAHKLKQKYGLPWIADLRDLWTQNHYYSFPALIKFIEQQLEIRTLAAADALVTVTPPWVEELKVLHKTKQVLCLTNGYDPEELVEPSHKLTPEFTITYTGILYAGKRDPSLVLEAIADLIREDKISKDNLELRFFGPPEAWLSDLINRHHLNGIVKLYGIIPREEALERQRESQLLLIVQWNHQEEKKHFPAKVFEYLAARRPIVAVGGPNGIVKELLAETQSGSFASNFTELKNIIADYYQEFLREGKVKYHANRNISKYSYLSITKKYTEILNNLL